MKENELYRLIEHWFPAQPVEVVSVPLSQRAIRLYVSREGGNRDSYLLKQVGPAEYDLYTSCLAPDETGAPQVVGASASPDGTSRYLLLQWLPGAHPDFAAADQVVQAFSQLAVLHRRFLGARLPAAASSPWPVSPAVIEATLARHPGSAPWAHQAAKQLTALPHTLVHGDFHRWNLLIQGARVHMLDWELGAAAHPMWDLVLLAPEEPGWEGVPCGAFAELALDVYHEAGPLSHLSRQHFRHLQTLARLFVSARRLSQHEDWLRSLQSDPAATLVATYQQDELQRLSRLLRAL